MTAKKTNALWRVKQGVTVSFKLPGDAEETHWMEGDAIDKSEFPLPTWERLIERGRLEAIDG